jgi:NADH-quinone oxidoreductase subunit N
MFMNLCAFAIVALIRNEIYSEKIDDYAGLGKQAPGLCAAMAICMFSLVGIPPLGGFFGKLAVFAALFQAGYYHWSMWAVLLIGGVNTVFSLFYYVNVLRLMFISERAPGARPVRIPLSSSAGLYVAGLSFLVLLTGIIVEPWYRTMAGVSAVLFP